MTPTPTPYNAQPPQPNKITEPDEVPISLRPQNTPGFFKQTLPSGKVIWDHGDGSMDDEDYIKGGYTHFRPDDAPPASPAETATPTPETDAAVFDSTPDSHDQDVNADFARRLERERDQAKVNLNRKMEVIAIREKQLADVTEERDQYQRMLIQSDNDKGSLRAQLKSMTDQFLAVSGQLGEANKLLREVLAVIEQRGVGHVVMYSDRITPLLPRIRKALAQSDSPGAGVKGEGL